MKTSAIKSSRLWLLAAGLGLAAVLASAETTYVSPTGNDSWSGRKPAPNGGKTDGPLATLPAALAKARATRTTAENRVVLRGGTYILSAPLVFTPEDSGLTVTSYRGETAVITSETPISSWHRAPGSDPDLWQAVVPGAQDGAWIFHELFINGRWAQRARLPASGYYRIANEVKGQPLQLQFRPGDIKPEWAQAGDVEMVRLQAWAEARNQIKEVSEASNIVSLAGSILQYANEENARYYIENAPGPLAPGQWRLDRHAGVVTYRAQSGDDLARATITAPRLYDLVRLEGQKDHPVHDIAFRGLTFAGADWRLDGGSDIDVQAAVEVPAAFQAQDAQHCTVNQCVFTRLGGYAIDLGHGCQSNTIMGCAMFDLGGGGIRVGDTDPTKAAEAPNFGNVISDNHIHHIGLVNAPAVGVLIFLSASNLVAHNEIDHTFYTTVSVGWTWGYAPNACHDNIIEFNHLHNFGQGILSDMGGVYTLGIQRGTIVRQNLIHDVNVSGYGGWGLYTDEGSSGIVLESNIVYRCQSAGMHQHYGETNLFYNNIFALNKEAQLARTRPEPHLSFYFTNNIVYFDSGKLVSGNWSGQVGLDHNLYFDTRFSSTHLPLDGVLKFDEWRASGHDIHSIFIDPLFVNPAAGDFRLRSSSPAASFGFHPFELRDVGVRKKYALPSHS